MGRKKKATLDDIAKLTGVSASTVSRVFSGKAKISEETKIRVYTAAEALGFNFKKKPDDECREIAFLTYFKRKKLYENPFFMEAIKGAYDCCSDLDYSLQIHFCEKGTDDLDILHKVVESNRVKGIILSTITSDEAAIKFLQERKFPFSVIGRPTEMSETIWVDNDNFNAAYNAVNTFFNNGKEYIAYIGQDLDYRFAQDRFKGYKQAHAIRGVQVRDELVFFPESLRWKEEMINFFKENKIDAVLADDEEMAFEILSLPESLTENISIIGFNYLSFPKLFYKKISLIDVQPRELGFWAAKLLIDSLTGKGQTSSRLIPVDIKK